MQIVFYACVTDPVHQDLVRRARITVDVGPTGLSEDCKVFKEYWTEASTDYLQGSKAHNSCCHTPSFDPTYSDDSLMWEIEGSGA
jgi:hypothetical protein